MKLFKLALVIAFCLCAISPVLGDSVLIVADEWPQMEILGKFLQERANYKVEKVEQAECPEDISPYDAFIMFVHGKFKAETANTIMDFTKQGGRLIVLHHGLSKAKHDTPGYMPFMGMLLDRSENAKYYYDYFHDVDYYLVNLDPDHYITSHNVTYNKKVEYESSDSPSASIELPAMEFKGSEIFVNHQFTDGRQKTVLFGFKSTDPKSGKTIMQDRCGWYKPAEKGWIFYFQPGHLSADFTDNYCQIILNALTWKP